MTQKKNPRSSAAPAMITTIAVLALFLVACDRGTVGIFASIEREEKTIQSNLPKEQTVSGFTEAGNAYFVAIGPRIWTRSTTVESGADEPWETIPVPTGAGEYVAAGVASSGSIVVAAFVGEAGSVIAVRDAAVETSEWETVTHDLVGQIVALLSAGDKVFVVERRSGGVHFLHHLDLTASPTVAELDLPGANPRVLGVAFGAGAYWFVTSDTVIKSDDLAADPFFNDVFSTPGGITNIGGITVTDGGAVVVSSNAEAAAGKVAYSTDGGTMWAESGVAADTRFPPVAAIGDTVYLGARRGVYTLAVSDLGGTPAVATGQAYESAALRNAEVLGGFFAAPNGDDIFILTNQGLWRRNVDDDSVSWIWE